MIIVAAVVGTLDETAVRTIVALCATCKEGDRWTSCVTAPGSTVPLLEHFGVCTWEELAIVLALKSCEMTDGGNRICFTFASVQIAWESHGTRERLDTYSRILHRHPRALAVVEAHCGPGAPPEIAHAYSLERADLVVHALQRRGVSAARVSQIGHGKRVSASSAVLRSNHPNAKSAQSGYGWAEIFVHINSLEVPARPDFYPPVSRAHAPSVSCLDGFLHTTTRQQREQRERDEPAHRRRQCVIS